MLSQDSEDEIRSRFVFELAIWLWQDELNPRVRCAFGNVYLHFTIAGGDTFSCYLPKLIFSFTFLPLPFIQPSFSSCLLLFFLWIFLLASPPTDIWACNWSSFCLFARLSHFVFIVLFLACLSWSPGFYILFSVFIVFDWSLFLPFYLTFISII